MTFTGSLPLFATCAPGLEPVLLDEVRALKLARAEAQRGGVQFEGRIADVWRANLELRTAIRVLARITRFEAADEDALYRGTRDVDWSRFVAPDGSLWIDARVRDSRLTHSQFVAQRVKDAICDQLRERAGIRPDVDREQPALRLNAHVFRDRVTLSADTSGDSLHKRGWRRAQGRAPLAETTAAGLVALSGWNRRAPLVDPFCGSGTIVIEAALAAAGRAPGLFRRTFGFEYLPGHDAAAYARLRDEARAGARELPRKLRLVGHDRDPVRVDEARANAAAAGFEQQIVFECADARDFEPRRGWNAWILANPPYGERLGRASELGALYAAFGERLRRACGGSTVGVLTTPALAGELALPELAHRPILNGGLECVFASALVAEPGSRPHTGE